MLCLLKKIFLKNSSREKAYFSENRLSYQQYQEINTEVREILHAAKV